VRPTYDDRERALLHTSRKGRGKRTKTKRAEKIEVSGNWFETSWKRDN
jgi:hypothetical protein